MWDVHRSVSVPISTHLSSTPSFHTVPDLYRLYAQMGGPLSRLGHRITGPDRSCAEHSGWASTGPCDSDPCGVVRSPVWGSARRRRPPRPGRRRAVCRFLSPGRTAPTATWLKRTALNCLRSISLVRGTLSGKQVAVAVRAEDSSNGRTLPKKGCHSNGERLYLPRRLPHAVRNVAARRPRHSWYC